MNYQKNKRESKRWILATILVLFSLGLTLLIAGCGGGGGGSSITPPSTDGITVIVEDASSRTPLSNTSVQLGNQTVTTNSNGTAFFNSLPDGVYNLQVSKNGYNTSSLKVSCAKGRQFKVRLAPVLPLVTDETFHQASLTALGTAKGLQEAISFLSTANDQTQPDPIVFFISSSRAFTYSMDKIKNYAPSLGRGNRSVIDVLQNFLSLTKVSQGTEQIKDVSDKLYSGQDVPEIDAWLAQHPYQGAHSLQELKSMYDDITLKTIIFPRLLRVYELGNPNSGFNYALNGAKDIWTSQFTQVGEIFTNLIGWTVDKVWSGTKDLVIDTINYTQLVLNNTNQIAWLWEKTKQKLLIGEVQNKKPMTVPQGTMDIIISNGTKHKPTITDDYPITGTGIQTFTNNAQEIGSTIPTEKIYTGTFSVVAIEGDTSYCAWNHYVSLNLELHLQGDGTLISPYTGKLYFDGYDDITLLVCTDPVGCDPGGTIPISGQMNILGNLNNISGSVTWQESEATNTLTFNGKVNTDGTVSGTLIFASDAFNSPIQKTVTLKLQKGIIFIKNR
ncbi:carboxypeptidase regulatory-like domain-containing protein [bacterium]|nr:carboxypeptidase regulatory-like domain-containing protein [bacterium]